jgi:hypothetical protein
MRRPGLWVANGHPGDSAQMLSWQPGAITCFYDYLAVNDVFNYKATNPDVIVTVRFRHPRDWQKDSEGSARQLGEYIAGKWGEIKPLDPYVYFANHLNMHYENGDPDPAHQPLYTTPEFYQKYARWVQTAAEVIKNAAPEMKLVTPPFAFGFNEDGSPDSNGRPLKGWAGYDYLQETIHNYFNDVLTFHAYWGYPAGGSVPDWLYEPELSSWYAFRWRRILKLFETRYSIKAKVLIDEVASFGPADPDFTDQLIYYAQQCLSDARVIGLTYFLWADPANDALFNLNAWDESVSNLAEHLNRLKNMPDVPILSGQDTAEAEEDLSGLLDERAAEVETPKVETAQTGAEAVQEQVKPAGREKTIRVLFEDDHVETMPLEEYLRGVVPGEMPALWPMEALKAQAVASRTYAQYHIEHPRFPNADICTTTKCQHYAPDKIHPRSDQAIQETRDQILFYEGKTINAVFSAHCGGHTRNNEDAWKKGHPLPYLRGVSCPAAGQKRGHGVGLCQYGAREFANQGRTYDEILLHYYQGSRLDSIPEG